MEMLWWNSCLRSRRIRRDVPKGPYSPPLIGFSKAMARSRAAQFVSHVWRSPSAARTGGSMRFGVGEAFHQVRIAEVGAAKGDEVGQTARDGRLGRFLRVTATAHKRPVEYRAIPEASSVGPVRGSQRPSRPRRAGKPARRRSIVRRRM